MAKRPQRFRLWLPDGPFSRENDEPADPDDTDWICGDSWFQNMIIAWECARRFEFVEGDAVGILAMLPLEV